MRDLLAAAYAGGAWEPLEHRRERFGVRTHLLCGPGHPRSDLRKFKFLSFFKISGSLLGCTGGPSPPGVGRRVGDPIGPGEFFESGTRNKHQGVLPDVGGGP